MSWELSRAILLLMTLYSITTRSGLLSSFLERLPLQVCKHVCDTGPVVVLVLDIPCSSSLDHVKAVYVSFLMGVPDSACILYCGAD